MPFMISIRSPVFVTATVIGGLATESHCAENVRLVGRKLRRRRRQSGMVWRLLATRSDG
jgi:hypothetical protein